jgi:hypothetical protein
MSVPFKDIRRQMTATAKRWQTYKGETVRRAMSGYPAYHERLTYLKVLAKRFYELKSINTQG